MTHISCCDDDIRYHVVFIGHCWKLCDYKNGQLRVPYMYGDHTGAFY